MQNSKKYYVYEHRREDDGSVFYVGKGIGRRCKDKSGRNNQWKNIVKKYGYSIHIIYECLRQEDANILEQKIIAAYGRENLCNMTDGGDGMRNPSEETRKLMSSAKLGKKGYWTGKKRDPEMVKSNAEKLKGRAGMKGSAHPLFGKKLSENRKKQNSEYMKNFLFSDDHKRKISEAKSGSGHHMFDRNIYDFVHKNGIEFSGTQFLFRKTFKLPQWAVSAMVNGKRKSDICGWNMKVTADEAPE